MAEPLYFGDEARPLFGWLHAASAPARLGLVVCNPFGYEAICAHRALRHFAEQAATIGVPALRFDYDGAGDSAGDDRDPDRIARWIASVGAAAEALKRHGGVERVIFLGLRLGVLLAAKAALLRDDCDGIVAIAPVVAGKAYVRELRALQMTLGLATAPANADPPDDEQDAIGFLLAADTKAALVGEDLLKLDRAPAPSVLILDRSDLPSGEKWAARLGELGAAVERKVLPGYVEMMLDADKTIVPEEMIVAMKAWLAPRVVAGARVGAARSTKVTLGEISERAERIGAEHPLFGVVAEPEGRRSRLGLILLNAGGIHHVGPNRMWVALARRWAARGHTVLRCDLSGVGDSAPWDDTPENAIYTEHAAADIAAAVAWMRRQPGVGEVHLLGLCSGAYHAYKAAVAGERVDGIVSINPLVFFYKAGESAERARSAAEGKRYFQVIRNVEAWKKLLRGDVQYRAIVETVARAGLRAGAGVVRELKRRAGLEVEEDLAQELRAIVGHRIALRFVFASTDPGLTLLRTDGGSTVEELRRSGGLSIDLIDGGDHTFTALWAQNELVRVLAGYFDR